MNRIVEPNSKQLLPNLLILLGFIGSLFIVFVGARIVDESPAGPVTYAGLGLMFVSAVLRAANASRADEFNKNVEFAVVLGYVGALISMALFVFVNQKEEESLLSVAWPALLLVSLMAASFMELARRKNPTATALTQSNVQARVLGAGANGIAIALGAVFVISCCYAASERDWKKDVSYFKTTEPSAGTLSLVANLEGDLKILLVYPKVNEVLDQIRPYVNRVASENERVTVQQIDHALAPKIAEKHHLRGNGFIVLVRDNQGVELGESVDVGTELDTARARMKTLDGRFREAFTKLTKTRREVYVSDGHDERSARGISGDTAEQRMGQFVAALKQSNIGTRPVGMAQGLGQKVPPGAPAVAVIGPRKPLLSEEAESLLTYVREGGRLLVMVDPTDDHGLDPLLNGLGVKLEAGRVVSDRIHMRRTKTNADRGFVYTNTYSAHPTVTVASRNSSRVATVFVGGGSLKRIDSVADVDVQFPIRTGKDVWRDLNENFERDEGEQYQTAYFMAAVSTKGKTEGRAVIVADGDFATDQVIGNPGNAYVLSDLMQWLLGEESIVSQATSEEDVRIEHTKDEDKAWFYATSFGLPLPLLAFGLWTAARRGRRRKQSSDALESEEDSSATKDDSESTEDTSEVDS